MSLGYAGAFRGGSVTGADHPGTPNEAVLPSVRAQLLATEHWSLLASRSTTQNELLVRIAIFLTLVSASVVSLALVGQATDFDGRFDVFTILLFSILLLVGTLTLLRVCNGGDEDLACVIGMNRLRAAYIEIDPGIDHYFRELPNSESATRLGSSPVHIPVPRYPQEWNEHPSDGDGTHHSAADCMYGGPIHILRLWSGSRSWRCLHVSGTAGTRSTKIVYPSRNSMPKRPTKSRPCWTPSRSG